MALATMEDDLVNANISSGSAASYLDKIIRESWKDEGKRKQIQKMRQKEQATEATLDCLKDITSVRKKLSSGARMNDGQLGLTTDLLKIALKNKEEKDAEKARKEEERRAREAKKMDDWNTALNKHNSNEKLLAEDLRALLRSVQREKDPKLPSKVEDLRTLWQERQGRLTDVASV